MQQPRPMADELPQAVTGAQTATRGEPKTLQCLRNLDIELLRQFQLLYWAIATGKIAPNTEFYFVGNEIVVEKGEASAQSSSPLLGQDDPSGKAEEIDGPDDDEAQAHAPQVAKPLKLTELVDEKEFNAFVQRATQAIPHAETGEMQAVNPDVAEQWQRIQAHAQTQAEMLVLAQLGEYEQTQTLIEALDNQLPQYAQMLLEPSLDALMDTGGIPQSELFVVKVLQRLSRLNSEHLKPLAALVFSMVIAHSSEPAAQTTETTADTYTAQPISLEAAWVKARCLLTIALATGASEQGLDVTCLSRALHYLSFVGTGKPILGMPDVSASFPQLTQAGVDALSEYLDKVIEVMPNHGKSQLIAQILKAVYTNSEQAAVSPILKVLVNHFKGSTIEVAGTESDRALADLAQGPLNRPINTPADIAERIIAVENALLELCANKITFEITQDDNTTRACLLSELTTEQKSEQLIILCQAKTRNFTPAHLLKVRLLLRAGVDATKTDKYGYTPLHWACSYGQTEMAVALINALIKVEQTKALVAKNRLDYPPLHRACSNGHTETAVAVIRILVEAGQAEALVATDNQGYTALHWACRNGRTETAVAVIRVLVETGQTEALVATGNYGDTPLHSACLNGKTETAVALIKALVDAGYTEALVATDNHGYTALHRTCRWGQTETAVALIKALVDAGQTAALVATDDEGYTPLHSAYFNGKTETAVALIKALVDAGQTGALVAKNRLGYTPLHWACISGETEAAVTLIRALVETRQTEALVATDNEGDTPLDWALELGHTEIVQALQSSISNAQERASEERALEQSLDALRYGINIGLSTYEVSNGDDCNSLGHIQAFRALLDNTQRMKPREAMTKLLAMLEKVLMDDNMSCQSGSLTTLLMRYVKITLELEFDIEAHRETWSARLFRFGDYKRTAREDFLSLLKTKLGLGSSATHAEVDGDGDDINTAPGYH